MECLFCAIVTAQRDAHVVLSDEVGMAFLDVRPVFKGHTLLVPRVHVETLPELPDDLIGPLFLRVRLLAAAMEEGLAAAGSFVAMNNRVSQSVPHLHVHVVPRNPQDGLRGFFWPRQKYASETEAKAYADRIRAALDGAT